MLSLDIVDKTILELESKDTTFANCERLAPLYIVRDHLKGYNVNPEVLIEASGKSEFIQAVNGKNPEKILPILDELMETVRVLHPKVYNKVIEKIKETV